MCLETYDIFAVTRLLDVLKTFLSIAGGGGTQLMAKFTILAQFLIGIEI